MFETLLQQLRSILDHVRYTDTDLTEDQKETLWEIEKLVDAELYPDLPSLHTNEETQRFGSR